MSRENHNTSLRHYLKVFRKNLFNQNKIKRKKMSCLTSKLQDAATELAVAEDEIQDLKFIDLLEAEEVISS